MTFPNFLGLTGRACSFDTAEALILPVPYEATVTYEHGTARGPAAIVKASQHVELYDREYEVEPAPIYGIHTLAALDLPSDMAPAMQEIAAAVARAAASGKLIVVLGGEHTITAGVVRGLVEVVGDLTVVQLDAHSDLRQEYRGSPYNHACVARRLLDDHRIEQILQLGVRSVSTEEVAFVRDNPSRVRTWYVEEIHDGAWSDEFTARVTGRNVHVTVDVDGLDPGLVPATGTPEPDGLVWREALDIVRATTSSANVVGIDCVELAPHAGQHAADFAVARLLYKSITYALKGRGGA
jgi:agmatinase